MTKWRIFFWAMLHSPEFKYCWIKAPITLGWRWGTSYSPWGLTISISLRTLSVYIPYSVTDAYYGERGQSKTFDDIPF